MQNLDWDDLRLALAIADTGGLSPAARRLGVNHSTVYRRLNAFEDRLGVRLFERHTAGYTPTAAGAELAERARRIADEVAALDRNLAGADLRLSGTVAVTTTDTVATHLLVPALRAMRETHPDIEIEVAVASGFLNLSKRQADVAIRPSAEPPETLVGRRIAAMAFCVYGLGDYDYDDLADLTQHPWIMPDETLAHTAAAQWLRNALPDVQPVIRSNSFAAMEAAAVAGYGLVVLPCFIGDAQPALVRVGKRIDAIEGALWVLTHEDLRRTARIRAFMEVVSEALKRQKDRLTGDTA